MSRFSIQYKINDFLSCTFDFLHHGSVDQYCLGKEQEIER